MSAIQKMLIDLDPETMVRQVMSDPNHQARVRARTERERKAYQTKTERELQAVKVKYEKSKLNTEKFYECADRLFQEYATKLTTEKDATTVAVAVFALFAGFCLAFV